MRERTSFTSSGRHSQQILLRPLLVSLGLGSALVAECQGRGEGQRLSVSGSSVRIGALEFAIEQQHMAGALVRHTKQHECFCVASRMPHSHWCMLPAGTSCLHAASRRRTRCSAMWRRTADHATAPRSSAASLTCTSEGCKRSCWPKSGWVTAVLVARRALLCSALLCWSRRALRCWALPCRARHATSSSAVAHSGILWPAVAPAALLPQHIGRAVTCCVLKSRHDGAT